MPLPDFLGIGAQRSGSTWLHELLASHPQIYVPRRRKEVHYFDWYYDRGIRWYGRFFGSAAARIRVRGEVTPDYLYHPDAPARISATLPACKLIVMLRRPEDRAISHYRLLVRDDALSAGFWDAARSMPEILDRGHYSRYLRRYLDFFGRDRLLVLTFERSMSSPDAAKRLLASFLGVDEGLFPPASGRDEHNASFVPRARHAYAAAIKVSRFLHRIDVDWPVRLLRAVGVGRLFGSAADVPPLSPEEKARLRGLYEGEEEELRSLLRLPEGVWSDVR